jgi:hypothetical protein
MPDSIDPKHVDKRTAERYLREGLLDEKAYERHLKSLPDAADKAQPVQTTMAETEGDEDEDSDTDAADSISR